MVVYRVDNTTIDPADPSAHQRLAELHARGVRLLCTCQDPPLEMYLARTATSFVAKRMPGTGPGHSPACLSYEPPPGLSGLAPLLGTAILEDPVTGTTSLRLAFALSRRGGQQPPAAGPNDPADTIKAKRTRLTLRGLLHYLWEQGQLTHWSPRWEGKRSWPVVRSHLLRAASSIAAANGPLGPRLYIPEPFAAEKSVEIAQRRAAHLAAIAPKFDDRQNAMLILIGELKAIRPSRAGFQMVVKHAPDFPFALTSDIKQRFESRFSQELRLWDQGQDRRIVVAATFSVDDSDYAHIEDLTAMLVTRNWIPIEAAQDELLISKLTDEHRAFFRVMRYTLPISTPVATAIVTDTQPTPVGLFILPSVMSGAYRSALEELTAESKYPAWFWQPHASPAFNLPPTRGFVPMTLPPLEPVVDAA